MNKARISGIIILILVYFLIYKIDNLKVGWFFNIIVGVIIGLGFTLIAFGRFNFWKKN